MVPTMPNDDLQSRFNRMCSAVVKGGNHGRRILAGLLRDLRSRGFPMEAKRSLQYATWIGYPMKGAIYSDIFPGRVNPY